MKYVTITQISTGADFGANYWYLENGSWYQTDAYYTFHDDGEDSPLEQACFDVESDIFANLATANSGIVGDFKWEVVEPETC